ncbi:hypothetical protein G9A89_018818 [Geosiphon pyriformis]|nr:hypothetical protein G9A89_018818 [Geosiphon pyriformis]
MSRRQNYLLVAGAMHAFTLCNTFLSGMLLNIFKAETGVPILNVLNMNGYLSKKLDSRGPIPTWFVFIANFIKNGGLSNDMAMASSSAPADFVCNTGFVSEQLLATEHGSINVYTDGSVKSLGSIGAYSSAIAYFPKANASIGVKVLGLLFSMLTSLNICKFDVDGFVKKHSDIVENEQADFFANMVTLFKSVLSLSMPCHFLNIKNRPVSENVHYFVRKLFESRFGADIIDISFAGNVDSSKSFNVWHFDGEIYSDYTSSFSAFLWSYLIKSLYYHLLVVIRKRLYNPKYPNIVCIRCKMCKMAGDSVVRSRVVQFLSKIESSGSLYMLLTKGFVLKSWMFNVILCLGSASGGSLIVKLIYSLAKNHNLIFVFYEKHNLLLCDESVVPLVNGLLSLWITDVICSFGIRLDIHLCFGLCSCLASLGFNFLNGILLMDSVCA